MGTQTLKVPKLVGLTVPSPITRAINVVIELIDIDSLK